MIRLSLMLFAALLLAACGKPETPAAPPAKAAAAPAPAAASVAGDRVATLYNGCVNAMVQQTCRVMQDKGASLVTPGVETIFVAGIGPVDAQLYKKLRESGEGMCTHVRDICAADWDGGQCKTARGLYGA